MIHLALAVTVLIALLAVTVVRSMASEEIRERLDRVPFMMLRLARSRVPRPLRVKLHDEEWLPELEAIKEKLGKTPLTWLTAGTWFALGLLIHARQISRMRDVSSLAEPASESAQQAPLQVEAMGDALEQARALSARIFAAQLAERRRIERDLHDGAQSHLLGIAALLTVAMTRIADPEAAAAFAQARDELRVVMTELRELAHGIHPAALAHTGLAAAIEETAERLPLPVKIISSGIGRLSPAVETAAYFIACEALANVVKHAKANRVILTIRIADSRLEMEISDDGIGGATAGGHGLANIIDRANALEGEVAINSPPGNGTRLTVTIPCDQRAS